MKIKYLRAGEMAQCVKSLAIKTDDLSLSHRSHMVEISLTHEIL